MDFIEIAKNVFRTEIKGLEAVNERLGAEFCDAVDAISSAKGRVIVCGMGKSGLIGKKISATLASTGTQSYFMHPGEAFHGDLGMVNPDDVFIGISYSGETDELLKLLPFLKSNGNNLIAITGNQSSTLAKFSTVHLCVKVSAEACPLQLAPTASTTATLAMGDALAVSLMQKKGFKENDFAAFHPGGSLGRRLLSSVRDEMQVDNLPFVSTTSDIVDVISAISGSGLGIAIVKLAGGDYGLITDGDIRRALERYGSKITSVVASDIVSVNPLSIDANASISAAWDLLDESHVSCLLVFENELFLGIYKR